MFKFKLLLTLSIVVFVHYQASAQIKHKKKRHAAVVNSTADANQNIFSVRFPKGKSVTKLNAYMLGLAHPVTFIVQVTHGTVLTAQVQEFAEPANIRINHIYLPDGTSDGPFSHTLNYPVKKRGTYKIIVGGNNMQGDDWKGAFSLRIAIQ